MYCIKYINTLLTWQIYVYLRHKYEKWEELGLHRPNDGLFLLMLYTETDGNVIVLVIDLKIWNVIAIDGNVIVIDSM